MTALTVRVGQVWEDRMTLAQRTVLSITGDQAVCETTLTDGSVRIGTGRIDAEGLVQHRLLSNASDEFMADRLVADAASVAGPAQPAAMTEQKKQQEHVTCPACKGRKRDLRATAPGHSPKDHGPCSRCRGFGTVLAANLDDVERGRVAA